MNNKYDITLSEEEKEQLKKNIKAIEDYLISLVQFFETTITLNAEWTFYDSVWGLKKLSIQVRKDFRYKGVWGGSEKEWYAKVDGKIGGLNLPFGEDFYTKVTNACEQNFALSLIDNWQQIKSDLLRQRDQVTQTQKTISDFKI